MANIHTIIVAAGSGSRFGSPLPKQFCELGPKPILMHTIDAVRKSIPHGAITLVLSADMQQFWTKLCTKHHFTSPPTVSGGATRWESVRNALASFTVTPHFILVHDAVRPFINTPLVESLLEPMLKDENVHGAIPAVAMTDSLRAVTPDGKSHSIDRGTIRAVQTPQAFRGELLTAAYKQPFRTTFTDDASVMEAAGFTNLCLTQGSYSNIKITTPDDMAKAQALLSL